MQEQQKEIEALKMELREQRDLIRKVSAKVGATKLPKLATTTILERAYPTEFNLGLLRCLA